MNGQNRNVNSHIIRDFLMKIRMYETVKVLQDAWSCIFLHHFVNYNTVDCILLYIYSHVFVCYYLYYTNRM